MKLRVALVLVLAALLGGCTPRRLGAWEGAISAKVTPRKLRSADLVASNRTSGTTSALVAGPLSGVPLLALLAAAVALLWTHRKRARAERAVEARGPLRSGPQQVAGVVEPDPGAPEPPVAVYVHQRGAEMNGKGGPTHQWSEHSRDVVARPFHLRRDDGLLIRVEPDAHVLVQTQLAVGQRHARDARTRVAEIRAGARVQITGELMGGDRPGTRLIDPVYRDAPSAAVLVPPRGGRMVISAEPPGETATRRARFHTRWAVALATALALLGGGAVREYLVLVADGSTVEAAPLATRRWEEYVKPKNHTGYWVSHYGVRAWASVGGETVAVEDECGGAVYQCARSGDCPRVPFVVSTHFPVVHQIGREPSLSEGMVALLILSTLLLVIAYPSSALATRPWYARPRVRDSGSGGLDRA